MMAPWKKKEKEKENNKEGRTAFPINSRIMQYNVHEHIYINIYIIYIYI